MKKLSILLFVGLFSINSYAEDNLSNIFSSFNPDNIYLGGGTGFTVGNVKTKNSNDSLLKLSETKNSINLFAGYNILPYLAIEGEFNYALGNSVNRDGVKNEYSNHSFFTNVVGKYPILERHIPFIKFGIGYASYENEVTASIDENILPDNDMGDIGDNVVKFSNTFSASGLTYKIGIGYEFAITKNHSIVADYNYVVTPKVDVTGGDKYTAEINYSTINVAYKFTF